MKISFRVDDELLTEFDDNEIIIISIYAYDYLTHKKILIENSWHNIVYQGPLEYFYDDLPLPMFNTNDFKYEQYQVWLSGCKLYMGMTSDTTAFALVL